MRALVLTACALAATAAPALADVTPVASGYSTEAGVLGTIATAVHTGSQNPQPVSGVGPAALFELQQHVDRFRLHLEGIPTVSVAASGSGPFGSSTATLGYVSGTALVAVDANRRVNVGFGEDLFNLSNHNGNNGDVNRGRITSSAYVLSTDFPAGRGAFETNVKIDPNLRGLLHIFSFDGTFRQDKPEAGAEVDYGAAYRWERGNWIYRAGVRGISYHTRDVNTGELVDRNVGGGITFDVRYRFGK